MTGLKNMIEAKFNKELYPEQTVKDAAEAFSHLSDIRISYGSLYYLVSFSNCSLDEDQTVAEFGNYLIDLMNSTNGHN